MPVVWLERTPAIHPQNHTGGNILEHVHTSHTPTPTHTFAYTTHPPNHPPHTSTHTYPPLRAVSARHPILHPACCVFVSDALLPKKLCHVNNLFKACNAEIQCTHKDKNKKVRGSSLLGSHWHVGSIADSSCMRGRFVLECFLELCNSNFELSVLGAGESVGRFRRLSTSTQSLSGEHAHAVHYCAHIGVRMHILGKLHWNSCFRDAWLQPQTQCAMRAGWRPLLMAPPVAASIVDHVLPPRPPSLSPWQIDVERISEKGEFRKNSRGKENSFGHTLVVHIYYPAICPAEQSFQ